MLPEQVQWSLNKEAPRRANARGRDTEEVPSMRFDPTQVEPKPCGYCGEPFGPRPSMTKPGQWRNARYCSISCGKRAAGRQRPRRACPDCGGQKSPSALRCGACSRKPTRERFMEKVVIRPDGCWLWTAHKLPNGYAQFNLDRQARLAHRVSYELHVGPIPEGMHLDHLCRNPPCVNPAHLEPVTQRENARRGLYGVLKTHCANGHPWITENIVPNGAGRCCRICRAQRNAKRVSGVPVEREGREAA